MINGGYYIKARKIQESDIAFAPPHVREIWDWILKEVNHSDNGNIKRGSTVRTLFDIADGLKWYIGYRKMAYSKSKCEMAMKWLRKHDMITTTKTTRGMIITVCNYDAYQNPKNYETNNEKITKPTRTKQPSDTINKNEKNEKNNKEYIPEFEVFKNYALSKSELININALKLKYEAWKVAGWKNGNGKKIVNWKSSLLNTIPYLKTENKGYNYEGLFDK